MSETLAEALSLRADRHKRMLQLTERVKSNALVQEGDSPSENADDLLVEFDRIADEFERINGRNQSDSTLRLVSPTAER